MISLQSRLLLVASLVLAGFLGATGLTLDQAFRVSATASMQGRLQSHVYALLAAAEEDGLGRMTPPRELPEPRFSKPDSGLYATIADHDGKILWLSHSLAGLDINMVSRQRPGERDYRRIGQDDMQLYVLSFGVAWVDNAESEGLYTFAVAEDTAIFEAEIDSFRTTLWGWLVAMAVVLLLAQALVLRWGLRPLRTVTSDLHRIEQGKTDQLEGHYPKELTGLTSSLNSLIVHSKAVQTRYRNSLDDLAHSLKTPLAILQSACEDKGGDVARDRVIVREQVERMDELIENQLQRAAVSGRAALVRSVPVPLVVQRLVRTLDKVYRDKQMEVRQELDPDATFFGDEADLTEILGNLLENAYKYCTARVRVSVHSPQHSSGDHGIEITVEDDGHGIAPEKIEAVLKRGNRLDETVPGHGIGLSMASEIITIYGGQLQIDSSELGGARLRVSFNR
jgi:two-component system sensor histidine kinase PhoQ